MPKKFNQGQLGPIKASKGHERPIKASEGHERPKQQRSVFSSIIYVILADERINIPEKLLFMKLKFHETFITSWTLIFFHSKKLHNHISLKILRLLIVSAQFSVSWALGMLVCCGQSVIFSPNFPK